MYGSERRTVKKLKASTYTSSQRWIQGIRWSDDIKNTAVGEKENWSQWFATHNSGPSTLSVQSHLPTDSHLKYLRAKPYNSALMLLVASFLYRTGDVHATWSNMAPASWRRSAATGELGPDHGHGSGNVEVATILRWSRAAVSKRVGDIFRGAKIQMLVGTCTCLALACWLLQAVTLLVRSHVF